jgi:hypothetical protein
MVVIVSLIGALYLQGNLEGFLSIGLGYYWERIGLTGSAYYPKSSAQTLLGLGLCWGIGVIPVLLGFLHFRARYYSYVAKVRSVETAMGIWLVMGILALILKFRRLDFSDFHLLIPPLVFYGTRIFGFRWPRLLRVASLVVGLSLMGLVYLSSWGLPFPRVADRWLGSARPSWLYGHFGDAPALPEAAVQRWQQQELRGRIWIMDHQPQWYQLLGTTCTYPYLDFRMAYHKFSQLPGYDPEGRIAVEPEREIFDAFGAKPPYLIIDPEGYFPALQQRYPTLFAAYRAEKSGQIPVYLHPDFEPRVAAE